MLAGANAMTIVLMLLAGYSDRINPAVHSMMANVGLTFPLFFAANAAFLVFWLMAKPSRALLPVAGMLLAYSPARLYCPVNIPSTPPEGSIKVLSYNVCNYDMWDDISQPCPVAEYVVKSKADIVCLEEAGACYSKLNKVDSIYAAHYQYRDTTFAANGGDMLCLLSRYPIVGKEKIHYASDTNNSAAFSLKIGGDTVVVVVNHFESTCLSADEKRGFSDMVKGDVRNASAKRESRSLLHKLASASARRAPQADAVASYVAQCKGKSVIVAGDFNDSPISYVRRTVARGLTDCYVATATGPGISYRDKAIFVRIDNLMCSTDFTPYACKVDRTVKASDHYPIACWLKKNANAAKSEEKAR